MLIAVRKCVQCAMHFNSCSVRGVCSSVWQCERLCAAAQQCAAVRQCTAVRADVCGNTAAQCCTLRTARRSALFYFISF
jgi:hypothetical protein